MTTGGASDRRMPALDGVRGVAVIAVVLVHVQGFEVGPILGPGGWFSGGFYGVDMFFVLSGFLITTRLLGDVDRRGGVRFARFWRARAFRLLPALALLMVAFAVYQVLWDFPGFGRPTAALSSMVSVATFTTNWKYTFDVQRTVPELGHLWSLAIEEQFYLVWPLCFAGMMWFWRRNTRRVVVVLAVAMVAVWVWRWQLFATQGWLGTLWRTDAHVDGLLAGCLTALLVSRGTVPKRALRALVPIALVGIGLSLTLTSNAASSFVSGPGIPIVVLSTAAIVAGIATGAVTARPLACAPLALVGRLSYGLYLWHFVVFTIVERHWHGSPGWAALAIASAVTAAATAASWWGVERPAQSLRIRLDRVAREPRPTGPPAWHRAVVAAGGAVLVIAAVTGRLAPSMAPHRLLPDGSTLQSFALLDLRSTPEAPRLLADALFVGGRSRLDGSVLQAAVRLPAVAIDVSLHRWMTPVSLIAAWLVFVGAAALATRRLRDAGRAGIGPIVPVACGFAAAAIVLLPIPQVTERWAWLVATAALLLASGCVLATAMGPFSVLGLVLSASLFMMALVALPGHAVDVRDVTVAPFRFIPSHPNRLIVDGTCPALASSAATPDIVWKADDTPAHTVTVRIEQPFTEVASVPLLRMQPQNDIEVRLEADGMGHARFVLVQGQVTSPGPWMRARYADTIWVTVDDDGSRSEVTADRRPLGAVANRSDGVERRWETLLPDIRATLGGNAVVIDHQLSPDELCQRAFDAAAGSLQVRQVLPATSQDDDTVATPACEAVFTGTGDPDRPWVLTDNRPLRVDVIVPTEARTTRGQHPIAAATGNAPLAVNVETDGAGRARFRFDVPYASAPGEWFPIDGSSRRLAIQFDATAQQFALSDDGEVFAFTSARVEFGPELGLPNATNFWFVPAWPTDAGAPTLALTTEWGRVPDLCTRHFDQHKTSPSPDSDLRVLGECRAVITGDVDHPELLEVADLDALVRFRGPVAAVTKRRLVEVNRSDATAVWIETDGGGRARVVAGIEGFSVAGEWHDVGRGSTVSVSLKSRTSDGQYLVVDNGREIGRLPMQGTDGSYDALILDPEPTDLFDVGTALPRGPTPICDALGASNGD